MSQEIQTTYREKQSEVSRKSNNTDDLDWIVGSKISNYTPNCNNKNDIRHCEFRHLRAKRTKNTKKECVEYEMPLFVYPFRLK